MGGVSQSRELCSKIDPNEVFVNTNHEELLQLLSKIKDTYTLSMRGRIPEGGAGAGGSDEEDGRNQNHSSPLPQSENVTPEGDEVDEEDGPGKFTEEEIEQLFQPFKYIYLSNQYLGDESIVGDRYEGLATLAKNKYLHTLDLSYNYLTHLALDPLMDLLRDMPNLRHLSLGGNEIGTAGCEIIAKFLAEDPPLEVLSLFHCELSDSDCLIILNGLLRNRHVKLLNLDFNYCSWKFLRVLIDLVKVNQTLAVVLFESMPHDPLTLKVLPQDTVNKIEYPCTPAGYFRSWHTYYNPDGLDEVGQKATAERFFLRRLVCKMDFTGLQPFPPSLLQELERYLAPRRDAYICELDALRQANLEEQVQTVVGAAKRSSDSDLDVDEEAQHDSKHPASDRVHSVASDGSSQLSRLPEVSRQSFSSKRNTLTRRRRQTNNGFSGSIRRELPPLNSPERLDMVMNDAYNFRRKIHGREARFGEKVLPNGLDRVWMAPLSQVGTKSANYIVNQKPSLLQACWCDPHDAASAFAGRLHYHCKREEFIDYSQSSKKRRSPDPLERAPKKPDASTTSLDSKNLNEGGQQKQPYHACQGTGHRCCSQRVGRGSHSAGGHKAAQGGPPRDTVTYTNKEGLVMELHYNPVMYFTSPFQPSAEIVDNCGLPSISLSQ